MRDAATVKEFSEALAPDASLGVTYRVLNVQGDPREVLPAQAEALHADLLVMGSRGLGAISKMILGSVSSYVSREAPCAVMIVR
jgi:nucleotide-binding universal stress UspA family protein